MNNRISLVAFALLFAACGTPPNAHAVKQTNCQVVWSNRGNAAGRYNLYIVDMPKDQWVSGTIALDHSVPGQERTAIVYDELDVDSGSYSSRAIALDGSVTLTIAGTAAGDAITISDAGGHSYFDFNSNNVLGAQTGDGGASSFTGVWSSTAADAMLSPGDGSVAIHYHGAAETIGAGNPDAPVEYALCYEFDAS